jgi:hypothetical protein
LASIHGVRRAGKWMLGKLMFRALGTFGLGVIFLVISPALRDSLMGDLNSLEHTAQVYSPFSYVIIGLGILGILMFCLHRASQPRT